MTRDRISLTIRRLLPSDAQTVAAFCARAPLRYLTLRLNLDVYGYHGSTVRAWGAFANGNDRLFGLLLRYNNTAILADDDGATAEAFAPVIDNELGLAGVRGTAEAVRGVQQALRRYRPTGRESSLMLALYAPLECPPEIVQPARRATINDLDKLAALYSGAWAMYRSRANVAVKLAKARVFVVEEPMPNTRETRIVSCALTNLEGHDAALIGGVFTLPAARGRGYAAACTAALALDLQRDGKQPCLFYENPVAGRVYRRLGFGDAGEWAVLYLNTNSK